MNTMRTFLALALALAACSLQAQTALTQTTLPSAVSQTASQIIVASASGITTASSLCIYDWGGGTCEYISRVTAISSTTLTVRRDQNPVAHASGAVVVIAPTRTTFINFDPAGACTNGSGNFLYTPVINVTTGRQWLCSTVTGTVIPGWGNTSAPDAPATAVASVAGATLPSGPMFHVTGTNAITAWTLPVAFHGGCIRVIADGAFTWTTASNIALASLEAMTAGGLITFCYDNNAVKWYPSITTFAPTP